MAKNTTALGKDLIPIKEVARHLGVSVKATLRYISQGRLNAYKYGRGYFCEPADVEKFKEGCRVIK